MSSYFKTWECVACGATGVGIFDEYKAHLIGCEQFKRNKEKQMKDTVELEYAYKLASTLMWKRFGDEKPTKENERCFIKLPSGAELFAFYERGMWRQLNQYTHAEAQDLWLYLSDLDVLRVKG